MTLEEMRARWEELNDKAIEIQAKADVETRDLTAEERADLKRTMDDFDELGEQISQRERLEEQTRRLKNPDDGREAEATTRQADPDIPGRRAGEAMAAVTIGGEPQRIVVGRDRGRDDPRAGYRTMGEYAISVIEGSRQGSTPDDRLLRASLGTFGSEGVGADGGFAVPPDFRKEIVDRLESEDSLLPRTDQLVSSSNNLTVPKDDTPDWDTTSGPQANWTAEAAAIAQSKPSLETINLKLHKLAVLLPITDELQTDAPALSGFIIKKAPRKIAFKINLAIVQGTGAGTPLGILNSAATVSVAKETSPAAQVANTVVGVNIINMWSRLYAPWRRNAVWLINQDIEPQLMTLMKVGKLDSGGADTGWGIPLWMPANGLSGSPFSTLMGRPVIPTQACETLGDKGDIILSALDEYVTVQKTTGIRMETSIHLWFDQDAIAFRFIMRIAGQPWLTSAITPRDSGSPTLGAFVTLDERA